MFIPTLHLFDDQPKPTNGLPVACLRVSAACISAANEVNNLHAIPVVHFGVFPISTPNDLAIQLNGNSLCRKRSLLNQFAQPQRIVAKLARFAIDLDLHARIRPGE